MWVEKSSSLTLIPIVRPATALGDQPRAQALDQFVEDRLEPLGIADVLVEGELARLRDHLALLGNRRFVLEPGAALKLGRRAGSRSARASCSYGAAASAASVSIPKRAQPLDGLRADSRHQPHRDGPNRSQACSRLSTTNPRGFSASEATLATSLFGPIPIEQPSPVVRSISRREPAHRGVRGRQAGQVEVGLVEPDDLDRVDSARTLAITSRDASR